MSTPESAPNPDEDSDHTPRCFRIRTRTLVFYGAILLVLSGPWFLRQLRINQVPLIPEPFDVPAFFAAARIPDSENAFVEYRAAFAGLQNKPEWKVAHTTTHGIALKWDDVPDQVKDALQANENSLDLWLQGTRKPKGVNILPEKLCIGSSIGFAREIRSLTSLAGWKQIRLQDEGHLDQSWSIVAGGLRTEVHLAQAGTIIERLVGYAIHALFEPHLIRWSEDPAVTTTQLRSALAETQRIQPQIPPLSHNLKTEYLSFRRIDPMFMDFARMTPPAGTPSGIVDRIENWMEGSGTNLFFGLSGEFEHCSRLQRHVFANWIAHAHLQRKIREVSFGQILFSDPEPQGPELPSDSLTRLINTSILFKQTMPAVHQLLEADDRDQTGWAADQLILALQIYHRDKGEFPSELKSLVPDYLSQLPVNPYADQLGGTLLYKVENDHVVLWYSGEYQPVPLEAGTPYILPGRGPNGQTSYFWSVYPPGTRPPLYRPYPPDVVEKLKQQEEADKRPPSRGVRLLGR